MELLIGRMLAECANCHQLIVYARLCPVTADEIPPPSTCLFISEVVVCGQGHVLRSQEQLFCLRLPHFFLLNKLQHLFSLLNWTVDKNGH